MRGSPNQDLGGSVGLPSWAFGPFICIHSRAQHCAIGKTKRTSGRETPPKGVLPPHLVRAFFGGHNAVMYTIYLKSQAVAWPDGLSTSTVAMGSRAELRVSRRTWSLFCPCGIR